MSEKTIQQLESEAEAARLKWRIAARSRSDAVGVDRECWNDYVAAVAKLKQAKQKDEQKGRDK